MAVSVKSAICANHGVNVCNYCSSLIQPSEIIFIFGICKQIWWQNWTNS